MAGLWTLIRLILRRDRIKLPLWIIGFVVFLLLMIPLLSEVYGDDASLATMYATFGANPAGLFMTGPMDSPSFGAFMTIETLLWWGVAIAFLNTLLVVRHTRHNEEIGAQELLLSGRTHRASGLMAALIVALVVNLVIAVGVALGFGLMDAPWGVDQSWLYGLATAGFGFVWAALAAVVVQLVENGRSANGILAGMIGLGFVVRGVGDFLGEADSSGIHQPEWMSSLVPFGWLQATRPLTNPDWSPLLIPAIFAVVAIGLAFLLLAKRDVGAGLLPSRKGRARATRLRATTLGLTLYLQKNVFVGWFVAIMVIVGTIGVLVPQMSDIYNGSDSMRQMIQAIGGVGELVPTFMSAMLSIICMMVFGYAVHGLTKLRGEESGGQLESLLATKVTRLKWLGSHVAVVVAGGLIMLATTGLVLALCVNTLSDFSVDTWQYVTAGLSYAPILMVFVALYVLLFGVLPRMASGLTWFYYGFVFFALWLGPIMQLDQVVMNLSVMEHVSSPPAEDIKLAPLLTILTLAVVGLAAGLVAWLKRNLIER